MKAKQPMTVRPEVRTVLQAAHGNETVQVGDVDPHAFNKCVAKGWIAPEAVGPESEKLALTDAGRKVCEALGIK